MSERLVVDSFMTADGEVVQLPTLGPLGPVDAQGGRIPLDTVRLFDAEGRSALTTKGSGLWKSPHSIYAARVWTAFATG